MTAAAGGGAQDGPPGQAGCRVEDSEPAQEAPLPRLTRLESESGAMASESGFAETLPPSKQDVWIHIYHCDSFTGFLNRVALRQAEVGIYHAGVEVYGEEWAFQYFEDTWDNPAISGVMRCLPTKMVDYDYQESVNLGPTPLTVDEVDDILRMLHYQWPACSYHITRNNCLTFAESFSRQLKVPEAFPPKLKGILEASRNSPSAEAIVERSWAWAKWWMRRKHRQDEDGLPSPSDDSRGGLWGAVTAPTHMCSSIFCPASPKKSITEESYPERCLERAPQEPPLHADP